MNNISSYCGLFDARIRASDKDLPAHPKKFRQSKINSRSVAGPMGQMNR